MSKLDEVIKGINSKFKQNLVGKLKDTRLTYDRIPFVSPALSYLFRGGLPRGIAVELLGIFSSGKSTFSYSICGEAQKLFKKEYEEEMRTFDDKLENNKKLSKTENERYLYLKDRGYQKVAYLDHEFSSSKDWMEKNGVDVDDLIFIDPDGQTAEELLQIILDLIDSDGIGLVVIDSIPALVSNQSMEKTLDEKTYAGISSVLSTFSQKVLPKLSKHKCTLIGINQPRDDLSGYHQLISPGGRMWKHICFIRLLLRKGGYYDDTYKDLKAHPDEAYGNYSEVEVVKNKATKPDRHLTKFSISYDKGVDGYNDTFNMAVTMGIIQKGGAWYSYEDENGNIKVDSEGNEIKWNGKSKAMEYLKEHNDTYTEIYNKVLESIEND